MKKRVMFFLFSLLVVSNVWSQSQNHSLYVYRNDGLMNIFLNSQIDSITYSKVDKDSILRDDWTMQDVWTSGGLYRIPLTAIDSLFFVSCDAIDLGLSVRWASCNIGASSPERTGGYYAWGETEVKSNYDWSTYIHCDGTYNTCHNIGSSICGTQYDVARVKWGSQWRMPTSAEQKELVEKCTWTWTTLNGVKGMKVTGHNGNSIFLPAAGFRLGTDVKDTGSECYYWSGSLHQDGEQGALGLDLSESGYSLIGLYRSFGCQVRPIAGPMAITGNVMEVSYSSAKITCSYKYLPAYAQCEVTVTSSSGTSSFQPSITSGDSCIFYLGNLQPQNTYTYQACILYQGKYYYGDKKSFTTLQYTTGDAIDLGLSVKWASCNVDASVPEGTGGYYAWGETEKYTYNDGNKTNLVPPICGTQYDVAHVKWGGQWRMPTSAEQQELVEKCTWEWTTLNGVKGMKVTGPNGNSIYLPAAGYRLGKGVNYAGSSGYYWSGSLREGGDFYAFHLNFNNYSHYIGGFGDQNFSCQVRPVAGPIALTGDADEITSNSAKIACSYRVIPADAQCGIIITSSKGSSSLQASIQNEGSYTFFLENLQSGITYTYQAYVLYQGKYYYGDKKSFTTATAVDLGLSVKWSSCNVGASSPEGTGGYYAWGETQVKSKYTEGTYKYYADGKYTNLGSSICGTQYDVAHVKWGSHWRMPTSVELQELVEKCLWTWTTLNGVYGMKVTGPNGNSIFLPAVGYRFGTDVSNTDYYGYYWLGSLNESSEDKALGLYFNYDGYKYWNNFGRVNGFQVRPVRE